MPQSIKEIDELLKTLKSLDDPRVDQLKNDSRKGVIKLLNSFYKRIQKEQLLHEKFMQMSIFELEAKSENYQLIAGIDEVGRGPLAGPVVAAAVILPDDFYLPGLDDSKKLSEAKKEELFHVINNLAVSIGIGFSSAKEIDEVNIYQATKIAMTRALENLDLKPDMLLIDAMNLDQPTPQKSITKGDAKSISIAAASVVAKVTRDRYMKELAEKYPHYKFEKNAGYGTKDHLEGLHNFGPCEEHRESFTPVRMAK